MRLEGEAYDRMGVKRASWRSAAARLDRPNVRYVRECQRFDEQKPGPGWLPGFADVDFTGSRGFVNGGFGRFSESEESHPKTTIIKTVHLRRATDESQIATLRTGAKQDREAVVNAVLDSW